MLICSINICFYGQKMSTGPYLSYLWPVVTNLQTGKYSGLGWIFWSSWVQMKEEDVYFHWFQAQYVTHFGPRAMGQPPCPPPPTPPDIEKKYPTSKPFFSGVWGYLDLKSIFPGAKHGQFEGPNHRYDPTPHIKTRNRIVKNGLRRAPRRPAAPEWVNLLLALLLTIGFAVAA